MCLCGEVAVLAENVRGEPLGLGRLLGAVHPQPRCTDARKGRAAQSEAGLRVRRECGEETESVEDRCRSLIDLFPTRP